MVKKTIPPTYNQIGEIEFEELGKVMSFRRKWVKEYDGRYQTITSHSIEESVKELSFGQLERTQLAEISEELFRGVVMLNEQINYLEAVANHENRRANSYKSSIKNILVIFLLVAVFGAFPTLMHYHKTNCF